MERTVTCAEVMEYCAVACVSCGLQFLRPFEDDPRFREVDFGIFEMHSYEELKDTPDYQAWLTGDNEANVPPNGESGVQMKERVLQAFSEIKEDTCIITHGGVIAAIMEHLFPDEGKNRYLWQPKNGRGYAVTGTGDRHGWQELD